MTTETRTEHTPGTWHVNAVDSKRGRIVGDETTTEPYDKLTINNANATIATVYRGRDARLIAAAPELLAALERCVDAMYIVSMDTGDDFSGAPEAALAAIAKARGDA